MAGAVNPSRRTKEAIEELEGIASVSELLLSKNSWMQVGTCRHEKWW